MNQHIFHYYHEKVIKKDLWRLTWYWLFLSYFSIEIEKIDEQAPKENKNQLRDFLYKTYAHFTENQDFLPEWAKILNEHKNILSETPCDRYAEAHLNNNLDEINIIEEKFNISKKSWFWHQLTLSIVRYATHIKNDSIFKTQIPRLIEFLEKHHGYRDEAIKLILERYYQCTDKGVNAVLRDYIIRPDIWKNPKLRNTGIASKWHYVSDNIWRMIFSWVTREHLRMFFEIIAGRHGARKDRFNFWMQYIDQITFTKLVFGLTTEMQRRNNIEIKKLFDEEDGVYARLKSSNRELDAFIMQIGKYTFVEFSMNGNAAFIYETSNLHFNMNTRRLSDDDRTLKLRLDENFKLKVYRSPDNRIIHNGDWQFHTKNRLMQLGIYPD